MGHPNAKTGTSASRPVVPWNKGAFVETQLSCRCEVAIAFHPPNIPVPEAHR